MQMHSIRDVAVHPGFRLRLNFDDGKEALVDIGPLIGRGGVFAALADPRRFAEARIGPRGRSIEWPGDIDLCADALWGEPPA